MKAKHSSESSSEERYSLLEKECKQKEKIFIFSTFHYNLPRFNLVLRSAHSQESILSYSLCPTYEHSDQLGAVGTCISAENRDGASVTVSEPTKSQCHVRMF